METLVNLFIVSPQCLFELPFPDLLTLVPTHLSSSSHPFLKTLECHDGANLTVHVVAP